MFRKYLRPALSVSIVVVTVVVFVYYFRQNPEVLTNLRRVSLWTLSLIGLLYVAFMAALVAIQYTTLKLIGITLPKKESALLMMYSSIINFFGPLQSGPAFRAAYLKKKHGVSLGKYAVATLLYYGIYAACSGFLIVIYIVGWWSLLVLPLGAVAGWFLMNFRIKYFDRFRDLRLRWTIGLAFTTLAQVLILSAIYYTALASLMSSVSYLQVLAYTGAANFALFVSLTPGAIGFRESFLLFTQGIHQISTANIASASLIDRSVYVVILLVMAFIVFVVQAQALLTMRKDILIK